MRIEKVDGNRERRVLTGMVVHGGFLSQVAAKWTGSDFSSPWANLVGDWCVKFYQSYQTAPDVEIEPIFESWAETASSEDEIRLVERFLRSLSSDPKEINPDVLLDQAEDLFRQVRLRKLVTNMEGRLNQGDLDAAESEVENYRPPQLSTSSEFDPFADYEIWKSAFESQDKPVIRFPGALGQFFGNRLERDGFISLMGPEKVGKSWLLMEMALRPVLQGRRVAYFIVGDMSRDQLMRRFGVRLTGRPLSKKTAKFPTKLWVDEEKVIQVQHEEREVPAIGLREMWKKVQRIRKGRVRGQDKLRVSVHPSKSLSAHQIESKLGNWTDRGWCPDVVVVDYADVLANTSQYSETRHQINDTWTRLRAISQRYHCLVVTATQTDASSYDAPLLRRSHFTDDKRKFAEVTGMYGINQNPREKGMDVWRFNCLALREEGYVESKVVYVAGCLRLAQPILLSSF